MNLSVGREGELRGTNLWGNVWGSRYHLSLLPPSPPTHPPPTHIFSPERHGILHQDTALHRTPSTLPAPHLLPTHLSATAYIGSFQAACCTLFS